jgi:EmrB/QacA subfamily drug resistance transporter
MVMPLLDSSEQAVTPATTRWVLVASVAASSMAFIDGTALQVAFPALQADLGASGIELLWIVNGYAVFLTSLLLLGGALGDRFGRRRALMLGLILFAGASCACGLAADASLLIAARAVQGVGAALLIPGSLALLTAFTDPSRRGRVIGTWSGLTVVATALGPILGGVLAQAGLWRGIFFLNLPLAGLSLSVLARRVPESRDSDAPRRLDVAGASAVTLGLLGVNYGLMEAPVLGWHDVRIVMALTGGAAALIGFVVMEALAVHPLLPLRLFRSGTFTGAVILTLALYGGFHALVLFLPLNLIQVQGYDAAVAGLAQLPLMILLVALSRWAGGILDRRGPGVPLVAGPILAGFGFLLLAWPGLTRGPIDYWTQYLPALAVLGVGMALTCAPLTATLVASVDARQSGLASGINSTTARLAGLLAVSILGSGAVFAYQHALPRRSTELALSADLQQALQREAANLGNARLPGGLDPDAQDVARRAVRLAFVDAFRLVCIGAAGLAWLGAFAAALLVAKAHRKPGSGSVLVP